MKNTAVDWLEKELKKIPFVKAKDAFKKAKQMEKEQIKKAFIKGEENIDLGGFYENPNLSEQYYQETYEKNG